jgi:hypothetical protein
MSTNRKLTPQDVSILPNDLLESFQKTDRYPNDGAITEIDCAMFDVSDVHERSRQTVISYRSSPSISHALPKIATLIFVRGDWPIRFAEFAIAAYGSLHRMMHSITQGSTTPHVDTPRIYFEKTGDRIHADGKHLSVIGVLINGTQVGHSALLQRVFGSMPNGQWIKRGTAPNVHNREKSDYSTLLAKTNAGHGHYFDYITGASRIYSQVTTNTSVLMGSTSMMGVGSWVAGCAPMMFCISRQITGEFNSDRAVQISRQITRMWRSAYFTGYLNEVARMSQPLFSLHGKFVQKNVVLSTDQDSELWKNVLPHRSRTSQAVIAVKGRRTDRKIRADTSMRALDLIDITNGPTLMIAKDYVDTRYVFTNYASELWSAEQYPPHFMEQISSTVHDGLSKIMDGGDTFSVKHYDFPSGKAKDEVRLLRIGTISKSDLEKNGRLLFLPPLLTRGAECMTSDAFVSIRMDAIARAAQGLTSPNPNSTVTNVNAPSGIRYLEDI